MKHRFKAFLVVLVCSFIVPTMTSAYSERLQEFHPVYQAARKGSASDIKNAIQELDEFLESHPQHSKALVYKGSLLTKLADISFWPWLKLSRLNEGIDLMNEGVDLFVTGRYGQNPADELTMYMVRALTCAQIPKIFNQGQRARTDLKVIREHQYFDRMSAEDQASVLAWFAVYAESDGMKEESAQCLAKARELHEEKALSIWAMR